LISCSLSDANLIFCLAAIKQLIDKKQDWQPSGCQSCFYSLVRIKRLGDTEPELGIEIDVVVPGEEEGGAEL